jgi:hypothetical protein
MRCDQIVPYLPGFAGGDLRPDTARIVATHVEACASCSEGVAGHRRVVAGLGALADRAVEPPVYMLDAILENVADHRVRRVLPVLPLPVTDVARVIADNRETIASAAGTALVAAGAAYALWRALRSSKMRPATS